jgi:hypothetical protein
MESHRITRYLRIAVTAMSITACALLIALWVRSYMFVNFCQIGGHDILLTNGRAVIDPWLITETGSLFFRGTPDELDAFVKHAPTRPELTLQFWSLTVLLVAIAGLPWLSWRFSLRTLLIATMLVAVTLGTIIYLFG